MSVRIIAIPLLPLAGSGLLAQGHAAIFLRHRRYCLAALFTFWFRYGADSTVGRNCIPSGCALGCAVSDFLSSTGSVARMPHFHDFAAPDRG